jgi:hypothetical protein
MPILKRLTGLYESRGILISTGLNSRHFGNLLQANFTWFIRDGKSLTNGLGIAMQEVYFLECLFAALHPKNIFAIGNSAGWSSFALSLLNPAARVVAIDAGFDQNALEGLDFTNRVAAEEGLNLRAVKAVSPEGVAAVAEAHLTGPIDFAFIDGYHAQEQVVRDFAALRAHAAADCVYLFHDVYEFKLQPGIEEIARLSGLSWQLLLGTPSGMAVVYDAGLSPGLAGELAPFQAHEEALALLADEVWKSQHRRLHKWRRSLAKRSAWAKRRFNL